jgi:hypothetical protein
MKKLQWINDYVGLEAFYGGGDYTVTVWKNTDWEREGGEEYEMIFCRSNTDIAHSREYVSAENIETEMRKYQKDLRRWKIVMQPFEF